MSTPAEIPFKEVLSALLDADTPLHPRYLFRLSDLEPNDLNQLKTIWSQIPVWRRQALLEDIEELGESDYLLSFEAFSRFAIQDEDEKVRMIAVRTLWEYESNDLVQTFLQMVEKDPSGEVRAAAASALGKYVYLGEIEELSEENLHQIEDTLLKIVNSTDTSLVRRRALESLGYSSRKEVEPIIESAYYSGNNDWIASALFAMGRSAHEGWAPLVMEMLENDASELRFESARAAGELEMSEAVPRLVDLLNDEDEDIRSAAIWSLSQIGGEGVREILESMYEETEDDEEAELIETALDNLAFTEDMQLFSLLDVPDVDDEDLGDDLDDDLFDLFEDDEDIQD
jgi:HEAT repeat protein